MNKDTLVKVGIALGLTVFFWLIGWWITKSLTAGVIIGIFVFFFSLLGLGLTSMAHED
jgi:hypothetical protein